MWSVVWGALRCGLVWGGVNALCAKAGLLNHTARDALLNALLRWAFTSRFRRLGATAFGHFGVGPAAVNVELLGRGFH